MQELCLHILKGLESDRRRSNSTGQLPTHHTGELVLMTKYMGNVLFLHNHYCEYQRNHVCCQCVAHWCALYIMQNGQCLAVNRGGSVDTKGMLSHWCRSF